MLPKRNNRKWINSMIRKYFKNLTSDKMKMTKKQKEIIFDMTFGLVIMICGLVMIIISLSNLGLI